VRSVERRSVIRGIAQRRGFVWPDLGREKRGGKVHAAPAPRRKILPAARIAGRLAARVVTRTGLVSGAAVTWTAAHVFRLGVGCIDISHKWGAAKAANSAIRQSFFIACSLPQLSWLVHLATIDILHPE
jgi:hypothetical protein